VDLFDRPLSLVAKLARVDVNPTEGLNSVDASILRDAYGWRLLDATARDSKGQSHIRLAQLNDGRRTIDGSLSDAGLYARLLYADAPVFGGEARINGELPVVGTTSQGSLQLDATGVTYGKLGATQYVFDTINLPMQVQGGTVSLQAGRAQAPNLTVKASGYVDLEDGSVEMRGLATPGGLNRLFGELPIFGGLLGSRQDEGLVGITLAVKGTLSEPNIQVNPISALAPGFLRRLFEEQAPVAPTPKSQALRLLDARPKTDVVYGPSED
jgi:hypothetical protein